MSAGRLLAAQGDCFPIIAPFMYPIMSLNVYNFYVTFVVGVASQLFISQIVLQGFGTEVELDKEGSVNNDYLITIALGLALLATNSIVPYLGLETKKKDGRQKVNE